ncbi:hypothetical protein NUW58_g1883 [Xylaria curta]|uniref:Uncharacterized protein n=1 Tax=Xylaria curta TaxID=42375 RepID=A0ACC1PJU7_9PEZI|nr:hypothetical protein NUW58_g1883 [Xylaria curta]
MSDWAPASTSNWDGPGNSGAAQWNDAPAADAWNGNANGNGEAAASFSNGDTNGFDATTGGDGARGGGGGGACYNCGQEGLTVLTLEFKNVDTAMKRDIWFEIALLRRLASLPESVDTATRKAIWPKIALRSLQRSAETVKRKVSHVTAECENPRKIDRSHVEEMNAEMAWRNITEAVRERDVDDVKMAIQQYVKACPDTTYVELETGFRLQKIGVHLIALESQSMLSTLTNMDLQGNLDKKYRVNYRFDPNPTRPRERELWPSTSDENLERLKDAGEPVSRGLSKCSNCNELGHISKNCPQEKVEKERVVIMCFNCNEPGHRVRDCPQERVDKFACKNCGKGGHRAADCPEPRVAGPDVECRKCGESGHFSRDCPQGGGGGSRGCFNCGEEGHSARDCPEPKKITCRNCNQEGHTSRDCTEPKDMSKVQCRNCDEYGHDSRGCPKPRDYSRVQCQNCGEMGHTKVRCKKDTVAPDDFNTGNDGFAAGAGGDEGAGETASGDWMKEATANGGSGDGGAWGAPNTGGASAW